MIDIRRLVWSIFGLLLFMYLIGLWLIHNIRKQQKEQLKQTKENILEKTNEKIEDMRCSKDKKLLRKTVRYFRKDIVHDFWGQMFPAKKDIDGENIFLCFDFEKITHKALTTLIEKGFEISIVSIEGEMKLYAEIDRERMKEQIGKEEKQQ